MQREPTDKGDCAPPQEQSRPKPFLTAKEHRRACKLVTRNSSLSSHARFLWALIETYADKTGCNAYPKLETLAEACGHKVDWVIRYRRELKEADLLDWYTQKKEDGTNEACRYIVLYPGKPTPINGYWQPIPPKRGTTGESLVMRQNGELDDLQPKRWRRA